jgi:hypothetical protein
MKTSSKIALITVFYNCENHLQVFFESLSKQVDQDFLVIAVDNASSDNSLILAKMLSDKYGVDCNFIANKTNVGIAEGNNIGIKSARQGGFEHIVLINNDISCDSNLILNIRSEAIDKKHLAWTCLSYLGDTDFRWYGGGKLSYWRARGLHYNQKDSHRIRHAQAVSYAPTCLMYIHNSVFNRIGFMDPKYFVYYDDTDFCRRLHDGKISLIYDPNVFFRHYVGGSSGGEFSEFSMRQNTKNKFLYIKKHYKGLIKLIVILTALFSKLIQLISRKRRRSILLGLRDAWGILKAN